MEQELVLGSNGLAICLTSIGWATENFACLKIQRSWNIRKTDVSEGECGVTFFSAKRRDRRNRADLVEPTTLGH